MFCCLCPWALFSLCSFHQREREEKTHLHYFHVAQNVTLSIMPAWEISSVKQCKCKKKKFKYMYSFGLYKKTGASIVASVCCWRTQSGTAGCLWKQRILEYKLSSVSQYTLPWADIILPAMILGSISHVVHIKFIDYLKKKIVVHITTFQLLGFSWCKFNKNKKVEIWAQGKLFQAYVRELYKLTILKIKDLYQCVPFFFI